MDRTISETESLLISSRNVPAGVSAGNISHDEMKLILAESGVEGVVNKLAKFGYGVILMKYLDAYQKTGDIAPMMSALHANYFQKLLESLKFFQGDEGMMRELIRTEIDKKNILTLLKAKESNLDKEMVGRHLVEGGKISTKELLEIFGVKNVIEIVGRIESYFKLTEALEKYKITNSLIECNIQISQSINTTYVSKLKNIALSIGTIFYFIINAEHEHENLKRIAYGKRYNLSNEQIGLMLLT